MTQKVWVIIPTFKRFDLLSKCLESLSRQSGCNLAVVVVDDACDFKVRDMVLNIKSLESYYLCGDGSRWWGGCMNIGLAFAVGNSESSFDRIISFNDDVEVDDDYVRNLNMSFDECGPKVMIGSVTVDINRPSLITFCGNYSNWAFGVLGKPFDNKFTSSESKMLSTHSLPGRGAIFSIELIKDIGFYDTRLFPQYFSDDDFSLRASKNGYKLLVCPRSVVKSHVEATGIGRLSTDPIQFIASLFSIRSPNQLSKRARFAIRHCPKFFVPQFIVLNCLRVIFSYVKRFLSARSLS